MSYRIAVCTTRSDNPHPRYWKSILDLQGDFVYHDVIGKQGVDEGHNQLVEWFLEHTDCEWMLHLDADAVVHPLTLERMLSWGQPMVSALVFQRKPPYLPVIYTIHNQEEGWKRHIEMVRNWLFAHFQEIQCTNSPVILQRDLDDALVPVDRGGAHCLLCHRDVFKRIPGRWFVRYGRKAKRGAGSDFYFYKQARTAGFQPYLDMSTIAGHLCGDYCVNAMDFLVWSSISEIVDDGQRIRYSFRRNDGTDE